MPFLHILWDPGQLRPEQVERIRATLYAEVASQLTQADQEHVVTEEMIDCQVVRIGAMDRIRSALFVTVLARDEPTRRRAQIGMAAAIAEAVRRREGISSVVVEIVLTIHASSFDYAVMEPTKGPRAAE